MAWHDVKRFPSPATTLRSTRSDALRSPAIVFLPSPPTATVRSRVATPSVFLARDLPPMSPVALPVTAAQPAPRVIIVGAGVAGLSCAQELASSAPDVDVVVLEARNRVGGRIFTHWLNVDEPTAPVHQASPSHAALSPTQQPDHASVITAVAATSDVASPVAALSSASSQFNDAAPLNHATHHSWYTQMHLNQDGTLSPSFPRTKSAPNDSQLDSGSDHASLHRHPFLDLVSGEIEPDRTSPNGCPRLSVDIGASILHGCADESQLVFKRAIQSRIRAPIVAGGSFYESTEHALWYDHKTGQRIPTEIIVEMHNIFFMASRYMAAVASRSDDGAADMQSIFDCGVEYVAEHMENRKFTPTELAVLKKICARSVGYCSPMSDMALMQASAGLEKAGTDAHIGLPYEEDDPPFPGEIPCMTQASIKTQAARFNRAIAATQKVSPNMIASRKGGAGDRIVLDGYTPFLIDRLKQGLDIRLKQSVCSVSKAVKPHIDHTLAMQEPHTSAHPNRPAKRARTHTLPNWDADPEVAQRTILVTTRSGEVHQGDFVVIAIPLGVLRSEHEESSVSFSPPLSVEKQEAIRGMGMGIHNKVVLRFREEDIFWPPKVPQLNCLDPRFQFFNMHCYGKTGTILVHVFSESGFANGYWDLTDEGVLAEVLAVLGGMFCSPSENGTIKPQTNTTGSGIKAAANAIARRRIARLLNICENCGKPLEPTLTNMNAPRTNPKACQHCGFVIQEGDTQASNLRPERMTRARANEMQQDNQLESDAQIANEDEITPPPKRFTWQTFPAPVEYLVTRWETDPFALGSYSYMPCGSDWNMIDHVGAPEPIGFMKPYIFFAGEHCSDMGWQCVHGAFETGIRAAKQILACLRGEPLNESLHDVTKQGISVADSELAQVGGASDSFWTLEREKALTRALIGYSDVYGNFGDVIDEISYALQSFKKEPTQLTREEIRKLILERINERVEEHEPEAVAFMRFHRDEERHHIEIFPKPFHEVNKRPRLVGLNGMKLKERYAEDIVRELRNYARPVFENQISYRETLRKIALVIYKKDGGLMTKRCLSEYLRTQEFGTGPQKELFLAKYLPGVQNKQ
eukprot:TRINITY_DN1757_c0_g1_i1.p1 TRINITY_DN1757_c0_g1~~TRINITY_DN1757_c0_g1_i1.p1  ORF type:complete len:1091 (-),score=161.14 TRINITY_DN1757_c0_g1_i1:1046-4318(-)